MRKSNEVLLKNGWNCEKKSYCKMEVYLSYYFCRYVPSFIPTPLAAKGKEYEKKVNFVNEIMIDVCIYIIFN